jgi:hypothetical protein
MALWRRRTLRLDDIQMMRLKDLARTQGRTMTDREALAAIMG